MSNVVPITDILTLRRARNEALSSGAPWSDVLAALEVLDRKLAQVEARARNDAWAEGRKGDGVAQVPWLGDTLTGLLRRFGACAIVPHGEHEELYRHVCDLRRRLKARGSTIKISTVAGIGYELTAGFDELYRLLRPTPEQNPRLAGFTRKQTLILEILWRRGSAHVDQIKCLQRHMSNIRAKLPRGIRIKTHSGEGLYSLDAKSRDALGRLLTGEPAPARKAMVMSR